MAIDTETKRASALNAGTFYPGKVFMQSEPDGNDLDDANQRGFVLWHYAGIFTVVAAVTDQTPLGAGGILQMQRIIGRGI